MALFEEDEDMNQGSFVETVMDQHLAEIQEYVQGLDDAMRKAGEAASPEGKSVPLKVLRDVLRKYAKP